MLDRKGGLPTALALFLLPVFVMVFFLTLLSEGLPQNMPVGVVDLDNTSTTRTLIRKLDAFQNSEITAHFNSVNEARHAIQKGEIYAFVYFPKGTTDKLLSSRRPRVSCYYSSTTLAAGALTFKDMKTILTLGSAAVGQATLRAKGMTDGQIKAFLQPIAIDLHNISNPELNYSVYLATSFVPACLMVFVMLLTAFTMGMEIKMGTARKLILNADGSVIKAILMKLTGQAIVWNLILIFFELYIFEYLHFPHPGGMFRIIFFGVLLIGAGQGFGLFMFGLISDTRMSMSICSLWAVLSFSMMGTAFPVMAMDAPLQSVSWLFPMRHYFVSYSTCILNDFPIVDVWWHVVAQIAFMASPLLVLSRIKKAFLLYEYTE